MCMKPGIASALSFEDGGSKSWKHDNCVSAIIARASAHPDKPALRGPRSPMDGTLRELSYVDFVLNAKAVMERLAFFFGGGERAALNGKAVAILLPRDVDFVVAMLACFLCGATYVPLSEALPPARIKYILEDSGAVGVITCDDEGIAGILAEVGAAMPGGSAPPAIKIEGVEGYVHDSGPPARRRGIGRLLGKLACPPGDAVAYMIYTSGTTGNPKGVEIRHRSMANVLMSHVASGAVSREDMARSVCVASFIFDSHVREVWMPLVWGGCACIADDVLSMTEGTMCAGTPTGLTTAAAMDSFPRSIRLVMAGGERLTKGTVSALAGKGVERIINAYGPTETVIESLVWHQPIDSDHLRAIPESGVPIGVPIVNNFAYGIKIADTGTERDPEVLNDLLDVQNCTRALAKRGTLCELYIGGSGVAKGYRNREDLTKERFLPDPFQEPGGRMYQTGDLVVFGELGEPITYVGRIDTQVKIRGKRLELGEISSFICLSDSVKDCQVAIKPYQGKDQLVAYIVWKNQRRLLSTIRLLSSKRMSSKRMSSARFLGSMNSASSMRSIMSSQRSITSSKLREEPSATLKAELESKMMQLIQNLEEYKRPAIIVSFPLIIDGEECQDFPMTVGGKVDLKRLPNPEDANMHKALDTKEPSSLGLGEEALDTKEPSSLGLGEAFQQSAKSKEAGINVIATITSTIGRLLNSDNFSPTDDMFKAGLSSMDVPALKYFLKQELELEYELPTDVILEHSTPEELAEYLANPHDENAANLNEEDFVEPRFVQDKPLPGLLVWLMSVFTVLFAYATSTCAVMFLALISIEILHETGKCSMPVDADLQNNCDNPDKWRAYSLVAVCLPAVLFVVVLASLVTIALMKWIVIGQFKPGCYSVDGLYYFRWLYVHHLEVFARRWLLPVIPMRCSFLLNIWLRLMGAEVGRNTVIDSLDIHNACLLTIGDNVTIQSDAMVTGHAFVKIRDTKTSTNIEDLNISDLERGQCAAEVGHRQALLLGKCWVKTDSTLGPYSFVGPVLPNPNKAKGPHCATIVEGILPGYQATSRLGQTIQTKSGEHQDSLVWTPRIPFLSQLEGIVTMLLLQSIAMDSVLFIMYYFFVPDEPGFLTWIGRCWLFFSPWPMGLPYAALTIAYKWLAIGRFKPVKSSVNLDKHRWILRCLCQSRLQTAFEVAGASSEILNTYYRLMGMKIGWNSQVMPLNIVEYDLFSIGDNVSFGGQVMVCCRDSDGFQDYCSIGNRSAITNSAGMLAGSSIGNDCLVGNLTLLPPAYAVPDHSKCVGTKYLYGAQIDPVVFANISENTNTSRIWSNLIGAAHILGSLMIDIVYFIEFLVIAGAYTSLQRINIAKIGQMHLVHNPWKVIGGYLIVIGSVVSATVVSTLTICVIKRSTPKFQGFHDRDSILFVLFIWLTKHQINMESWSFLFNGTPIQSLCYSLLGADISMAARLFMRFFADVDGLVVRGKSVLSYDCYMEQHKKTSSTLEFGPISVFKSATIGQRSIILKDATLGSGSHIYPLSALAPKEFVNAGEVRGGVLAESYFLRGDSEAIAFSALDVSTQRRPILKHVSTHISRRLLSSSYEAEENINMVVIGAGISGLIAAHEFQKNNISVKILEKTSKIMGCWEKYANPTSHVAVTEATYRLDGTKQSGYECDYPSRAQVLDHGADFFHKHGLHKMTEFDAKVICVEEKSQKLSEATATTKSGRCIVTYKKNDKVCRIRCKGVFIATGAQALRNEVKFNDEEKFTGEIMYGSNDLGRTRNTFRGKSVCIIGGGAFAMENVKTALTHGAKHVTVVHRSDFQVWPRCVHYLLSSSEKDRQFAEYNQLYQNLAGWAGLTVGAGPSYHVSPFMHQDTSAQPTANDSFFAFYKLGLVTLLHGNVKGVNEGSITVENKSDGTLEFINCDVILKCVGWKDPGRIVRDIFPSYKSRNFIFLNNSPRIVYICDPRYRHTHQVGEGNYSDILNTVPIGGTYSVPILARIAATLQIYCLGNPGVVFDALVESIPASKEPVCSWTEAKFQYPNAKEASDIVRNVIDQSKSLVLDKHPSVDDFVEMNMELLRKDLEKRIANCQYAANEMTDSVRGFQTASQTDSGNRTQIDVGYEADDISVMVNEFQAIVRAHFGKSSSGG